jgi:hypothetical protein
VLAAAIVVPVLQSVVRACAADEEVAAVEGKGEGLEGVAVAAGGHCVKGGAGVAPEGRPFTSCIVTSIRPQHLKTT